MRYAVSVLVNQKVEECGISVFFWSKIMVNFLSGVFDQKRITTPVQEEQFLAQKWSTNVVVIFKFCGQDKQIKN